VARAEGVGAVKAGDVGKKEAEMVVVEKKERSAGKFRARR